MCSTVPFCSRSFASEVAVISLRSDELYAVQEHNLPESNSRCSTADCSPTRIQAGPHEFWRDRWTTRRREPPSSTSTSTSTEPAIVKQLSHGRLVPARAPAACRATLRIQSSAPCVIVLTISSIDFLSHHVFSAQRLDCSLDTRNRSLQLQHRPLFHSLHFFRPRGGSRSGDLHRRASCRGLCSGTAHRARLSLRSLELGLSCGHCVQQRATRLSSYRHLRIGFIRRASLCY